MRIYCCQPQIRTKSIPSILCFSPNDFQEESWQDCTLTRKPCSQDDLAKRLDISTQCGCKTYAIRIYLAIHKSEDSTEGVNGLYLNACILMSTLDGVDSPHVTSLERGHAGFYQITKNIVYACAEGWLAQSKPWRQVETCAE